MIIANAVSSPCFAPNLVKTWNVSPRLFIFLKQLLFRNRWVNRSIKRAMKKMQQMWRVWWERRSLWMKLITRRLKFSKKNKRKNGAWWWSVPQPMLQVEKCITSLSTKWNGLHQILAFILHQLILMLLRLNRIICKSPKFFLFEIFRYRSLVFRKVTSYGSLENAFSKG